MGQPTDAISPTDPAAARLGAAERVRALELELGRAQGELAALGGEALVGLHLEVEAAGRRALLPASRVQEVVRLVAMQPLPGAPPAVLGTFVCRGVPVAALDLAVLLGVPHVPPLDAQIAVLGGSPAVGLVVDRIRSRPEPPRFHGAVGGEVPGWEGSRLVVGLCTVGDEVLPLLDAARLTAAVREVLA